MNLLTRPPKKVLIINIFGIGDVLFTTPLISNLKLALPDLQIGYLCNRRTVEALENNRKINRIFVYERDAFNAVYQKSRPAFVKKMLAFWYDIRKERYDAVIDVSLSSFTSFFTWVIGIPRRIGYDFKGRSFYLNKKFPMDGYENKHVVEYYLRLLEDVGIPVKVKSLELAVSSKDQTWAAAFLKNHGVGFQKKLIGLVPGGGASWGKDAVYKRWSAENYAKLADKIVEKFASDIILLGDTEEMELCRRVGELMHSHPTVACGETTLGQFAALTAKCHAVILNDGGPLHIAAAAGAKTVSIFGPVDDRVYGPYPLSGHKVVKKDLPCRPCYRGFRRASCEHISCLHRITVDDVLKEVEKIL